jgi:hypothetical protein
MRATLQESPPLPLPPTPPDHHLVALFGILVTLPNAWNLHAYRGDTSRGLLIFADLRQPTLELRWQPARKNTPPPSDDLTPTPTGLALRANDPPDAPAPRSYELHFPRNAADPIAMRHLSRLFRQHLPLLAASPTWYWSLYGAAGWLPKTARLTAASLLPGAVRLTFRHKRLLPELTILGSFSRADQLREDLPLKQLALSLLPELRPLKNQHWTEAESTATLTATPRFSLPLFPRTHTFTLTHDHDNNRLPWTHRTAPSTKSR